MAIAGQTRFRKHQVGKQTVLGTAVAATRVLPYRGAIVVNPARAIPDVDTGSLDTILPPTDGAREVTSTWDGPAAFNDMPYVYAAVIKGGITPTTSSTSRTWVFQAASLTSDPFEYFTDEWGDDTSASDGIRAFGGVGDGMTLGFGDDLGVFNVNTSMVYAGATLATDRTAALTVDSSPTWLYGADTEIFLDTVYTAIGTTKLTDAIHSAELSIQNNLDRKRFANGSNTRFQLAGYGRGERVVEVTLTVAKTAATMAERATLVDTPVPNRFLELRTTSPTTAAAGIPYSNSVRIPARLITASDGEIGGNSVITFTYRGNYDANLLYAIRAVVVDTLSAL